MSEDVMLVLTTVPDDAVARRVAETLVAERFAACVTVLGPARSTYRWQGVVECADELPLLLKTTVGRWPALRDRLRALHPYDVPEMLAWRAADGWPAYLGWVRSETEPEA